MALLLGMALLVAQLINFALILSDREKLSVAQSEAPAITRFVNTASDIAGAAPEFRDAVAHDNSRRGAHFALRPAATAASAIVPAIAEEERDPQLEERLTTALRDVGIVGEAKAARGQGNTKSTDERQLRTPPPDMQILRMAVHLPDGSWLEGRMVTPRRDPFLAARLAAATLLVYLVVLGAAVWGARRLARPLRDLTDVAENFAGRSEPQVLEPRGPDDLRLAMEAFNAMNGRIVSLLDEKDHLLGAIGHDMRTPLASLRIRLEGMEPADERSAAIAKVEEMVAMLEDILMLARTGRARGDARPMDVSALVDTVTEEYLERGEPVRISPSSRLVTNVQGDMLRRALRNLIDNAVIYGGGAEVTVQQDGDRIIIGIRDNGPGMADEDLERAVTPFQRLEASRNRNTGGSGLGLAIARSIAEVHGGSLSLARNHPNGLIAKLVIPVSK
jgi:signal transduction histidine kinase